MSKKFFCIIFLFLISSICFAKPETFGYSSVTITNNTMNTIIVQPSLETNDQDFILGKDWEKNISELAPYETKQVLWFSRNNHIKINNHYLFTIQILQSENPVIKLSFDEIGKSIYGSSLTVKLTLLNQEASEILQREELQIFPFNIGNDSFDLYANANLNNNVFDDFHFTINQNEINQINTDNPNEISILTYNTQLLPFYANIVDDLNQPSIRVEDIPEKIMMFDVVILEELFDRDLRNTMISKLEKYYPFHTRVVGDNTTKPLTGGTMIFSKWPIANEDQIVYSEGSGADRFAAKGAIYAAINKTGKIYHIFGTHLQASDDQSAIRVRQNQLQELANFIERMNLPATDPIIIGGDFNIDEFNQELITLLATLQVDLVKNIGYQFSFDGSLNTMAVDQKRARIDYIFYNQHHQIPIAQFNKVFVLRDLDNRKMWPKFDLSDHFPVWSYFKF